MELTSTWNTKTISYYFSVKSVVCMALSIFCVTNVIILLKTLPTKKSFRWNLQHASHDWLKLGALALVIAPVYLWL